MFLSTLFSPTMIIALLLIGVLIYGRELPKIARNAVKQYYGYERMVDDATTDLKREMDSVADRLERENRKLQCEFGAPDRGEELLMLLLILGLVLFVVSVRYWYVLALGRGV